MQQLIASGHDFAAIQRYTERQIELFYLASLRLLMNEKADQIEAVGLGFNGGKETAKYVKQLRNFK